jgi:RNA 2',3'-cyclic 3'-phosphodiesterase
VRVFAAFPLPGAVADVLDAALVPLRRSFPKTRWVSMRGVHLTVHFFGEVPDEAATALKRLFAVDPDLVVPLIPARLGRLGQFPPRGNPRVIWAGLDRGAEELGRYWTMFEGKVAPLGWPSDPRGFSPHVTVARAGGVPLAPGWSDGVDIPALDFFFEECVLFQSIPGRGGAEYLPLARAAFRGEAA